MTDDFASGNRWEPAAGDRRDEGRSRPAAPADPGVGATAGAPPSRRWTRRRLRWQAFASIALAVALGTGVAGHGLGSGEDHGWLSLAGLEQHSSDGDHHGDSDEAGASDDRASLLHRTSRGDSPDRGDDS